jgi:glycosyltransferase involved in cell wall biosynthesis
MPASGLRLLVLNTDLPIFPGGGGVEFLAMTRLAARLQAVGLVSMAHTRNDLERSQDLVDAGVGLYLWESPWLDAAPQTTAPRPDWKRRVHRWLRDALETWRAGGRPADTRMMDAAFANMAPGLTRALGERSWHTVAVVQSSAAAMINRVPRHLVSVLVMHDIRARVYQRRAAVAGSLIERWRLERQASRYASFEGHYCRLFDLVVTVSADDARWVESQYRPPRVYELALPVDTAYFTAALPSDEQPGRIVFTGLLNHPPNVDAAVYFAKTVLPVVRRSEPSAEFHIVGRHPVPEVVALAALPNVRLFPNVPDIRTHLRPACVVVVPLRYGSGARQKILEAWSMEKCVISTTVGAEGLAYEDGSNLFIANDTETMASTVVKALRDPALRGRVRHRGRVVAESRHNPERLAAGYDAELTAVARQKAEADARMRVLIDMRWMLPGVAGGIETIARAFMRELLALDASNQYCALVPARCRYDFDVRGHDNVRIVCQDSAWDVARALGWRAEQRLLRSLRLPNVNTPEVRELSRLAELGVEIGYSFPGYIHPQLWPLRNVLIIPDIQHEYFPEFFAPDALEERRRVYTDAARRADHICAISEFTRQTLIDKLGVEPNRVTTVPLAAEASFRPDDVTGNDPSVLDAHGLTRGGYLYFPAHTWMHKNHVAAVEVLRLLRDRCNIRLMLVCSGGAREAQLALDAKIDAAGLRDQVRFLGYVPRRDVPALYRGAACLLFPSLFEGFGMPVLEAMASGCPVVCSNTTSLPEIAGDAAELVEPRDVDALAAAVARLAADRELRSHRIAAGLARSKIFSWRRHTIETVSVLRKVHEDLRRF